MTQKISRTKKSALALLLTTLLLSFSTFGAYAEPISDTDKTDDSAIETTVGDENEVDTDTDTEADTEAELKTEAVTDESEKSLDDTEDGGKAEAESADKNDDSTDKTAADDKTVADDKTADDSDEKPQTIEVMDRSGGMLSFLNRAFGAALKWLNDLTGSYLIAILLFALIIKILLFPLSIKQQKSSQLMAKLAPRQEAIRKKYAGRNDKASQMKMNEEIQNMYAEEKYNPMGGCLPMLIQLPIIMVLYTVITNPLSSVMDYTSEKLTALSQLFTANSHLFEGVASKISETDAVSLIANAADPAAVSAAFGADYTTITEFYKTFQVAPGLNLMDKPTLSFSLLLLVPICVFLASFFSTKLIRKFSYNPTAGDAQTQMSNKFMDWTMPLMILWFSFSVPALVGVYWIFQNVISIGQQYLMSKLYPIKAPTPEEIREAELLMRGKTPNKKSKKATDNNATETDGDKHVKKQPVQKAALKKKKAKSPFIYAKKGIDPAYMARVKAKGKVPKAKMKP